MSEQTLLRFLRAGLINVGGDDAKLDRLRETAGDLAATLKKRPSKTAAFALIAFDPDAPADDPVINEAMEALEKRWATYGNTFAGKPVAVIRAMLLDALVRAAGDDERIAVAFVTSARNALPFTEGGAEGAIWADVVADIERRVDARSESEWATPEAIHVGELAFVAPPAITVSSAPPTINKAALAKKFEAAAGPSNHAGQNTSGNPAWPQNNPGQWVTEFGKRAADTVAELVESVAQESQIEPIDLAGPLNHIAQAVAAHVRETLKAVSGATAGLQRRTNLIWWKETLYSPSARASYRAMRPSVAGALMALDLYHQVPTFSPASVAAFLHEAVLSLPSIDADERHPMQQLVDEAVQSHELAPLREEAVQLFPDPAGRGPVLGLIGHRAADQSVGGDKFRARVGVEPTVTLTVPEWATWLFRELQAARATQEVPEAKKRGRKSS